LKKLRSHVKRVSRQVEDPDASDQLERRSVRRRRRRIGIAGLALAIVAGGIGVAGVAFAHQGQSVIPPAYRSTGTSSASVPSSSKFSPALCSKAAMQASIEGTEGAAGTIQYVWRAQNVSGKPCRSFGYPGMDVHGTSGWLNLHVHRGGFPDINQTPRHILVAPGHSLYFVGYWWEVTTNDGPCTQFDRVEVTLPDNYVSTVLSVTGCLSPDSVDVGPVTTSVPAP